jgi:hypothetical protein
MVLWDLTKQTKEKLHSSRAGFKDKYFGKKKESKPPGW